MGRAVDQELDRRPSTMPPTSFAAIGASTDGVSIAGDNEAYLRESWAREIEIDADPGGR
jgi:hypothetical protein